LFNFSGTGGSFPGANPRTQLILGADNNLYGVAPSGGAFNQGVVFRVSYPFPPVLQSVLRTNSVLVATCSAVAAQSYQVQYNTNLGASDNWLNLGPVITATNGFLTFSDSIGADPQHFYRVVLLP